MPSTPPPDLSFADLGPVSRTYLAQLEADRRERIYEIGHSNLYAQAEEMERDASAVGRMTAFGLSSIQEWVESHPELKPLRDAAQKAREEATGHQEQIGGIAYCIAVDNLPALEKKLASLNRKAGKLGTEPISLVQSDERQVFDYTYAEDSETHRGYNAEFEHVYCTLKGGTPKIPGFEFIATIQHLEEGNLLRTIPEIRQEIRGVKIDDLDLSEYRERGPICEQCGKHRQRKNTYLIYNLESGEMKQVGKECLRDYTGTNNPEKVADWLEFYWEFEARMRNSRGEQPVVRMDDFLTHCALMIREEGRFQPRSSGTGTADFALTNYWNMKKDQRNRDRSKAYSTPEAQDERRAKVIREWALNDWDEESNFALNVKTALKSEVLRERTEGIAAAAFIAYEKWLANAEKRDAAEQAKEKRAESQFVGEVKQRQEFTLTLKRIIWIEDRYSYSGDGTKPLLVFEDQAGNSVKWFASNMPYIDSLARTDPENAIAEGETYLVKATVKRHEDDPKYGKQTIVTRAKILKIVDEPQEAMNV